MSKLIETGLTFDDVLLVPQKSKVNIRDICTKTKLTKSIHLNSPVVSSPLDTVTESQMAIAIARQGGIGFIHDAMDIQKQAIEVDKVKRSEHGVITDPFSLSPNHYVYEANNLMSKFHISGVPITENGFLVGIITNRDLKFEEDHSKKIYEVMTRENLITAPVGTSLDEAKKVLTLHKIEKLPLTDEDGMLKGLITIKDIDRLIKYPNSAKDDCSRLVCGAKVSISEDMYERIDELIKVKVDVIALTKPNGYDEELIQAVKNVKEKYPTLQVIAGNIATKMAAKELIDAGADGLLVGIGAGSICTSRVISGSGVPQVTAIMDVFEVAKEADIPIISDGGVKYSGDVTKAIGAGASSVMIGGLFVGCDESPGTVELYKGRKYKIYRGINPLPQINTNKPKMFVKEEEELFVPESIEGRVSYKGPVKDVIKEVIGGLLSGMNFSGASNIEELKNNSQFIKISDAGLKESHPHNIQITKESSNYSLGDKE